VQKLPFFAGIDWENLHTATPPYVPKLASAGDTSHFNVAELNAAGAASVRPTLASNPLVAMQATFAQGLANIPFVGWSTTAPAPAAAAPCTAVPELLAVEARLFKEVKGEQLSEAAFEAAAEHEHEHEHEHDEVKNLNVHRCHQGNDENKSDVASDHEQQQEENAVDEEPVDFVAYVTNEGEEEILEEIDDESDIEPALLAPALAPVQEAAAVPAWKMRVLAARQKKQQAKEACVRLADPNYVYAHLPEWKRALKIRQLEKLKRLGEHHQQAQRLNRSHLLACHASLAVVQAVEAMSG
jgi:hypothetical protein